MKKSYQTPASFFASEAGRRLQNRVCSFLTEEETGTQPSLLIGSIAPFLTAFEQNRPDILSETEALPENTLLFPLPAAGSVSFVFGAFLNESVVDARSFLIKEIHRVLKPKGRFFLITKNRFPVQIQGIPSISARKIRKELIDAGFIVRRKQSALQLPFHGKTFDTADRHLFAMKTNFGAFSFFAAEKQPFIAQTNENYSSTRITKASVFTSPRT